MTAGADRQRVQRASVAVGLWVGGASAAIVALITVVTVVVVAATSRPDARPGHDGDGFSERIINLDQVVILTVALGVVGVVALGGIAWWAARRSSIPLAAALRAQRDFVADASHELRTPLTTLTSRIQVAQHRAERGGDVAGALSALRQDAVALDAVLTDLLLSAESAGTRPDGSAASSVLHAARAAVETIRPQATAVGVSLDLGVPEGLRVAAEETAVTRAVVALLDNAVRHTPTGARVWILAEPCRSAVEIRVVDEGTGIAGIEPDRVFDRFARTAGDTDRRGFGLGMALVRDIATRFGGRVSVERTSPHGTTFLLVLPTAAVAEGRHRVGS